MAVLEAQPRIVVSIKSNGTQLTEYVDNGDEADGPFADKTVIRYIEAVPNTSFSIFTLVRQGKSYHCDYIAAFCTIDGIFITSKCLHNHQIIRSDSSIENMHQKSLDETGRLCNSKYKFKELEVVEDASLVKVKEDMKRISKIGEIKVYIYRMNKDCKMPLDQKHNPEVNSIVSEKAIKGRGLSQGFTFGKTTPTHLPAPSFIKGNYVDGPDKPLAVFVFKYRSRSILQSMGLIPRSQTPDLYDQLTAEEKERIVREALARRRENQIDVKPNIKTEKKRERGFEVIDLTRPAKVLKRIQSGNGKEVFDLTDD